MTATAIAAAESPDVAGPRTTVRSTLAVSLLAALPVAGRSHAADAAAMAGGRREGRHRSRGQVHDRDDAAGAGGGACADAAAAGAEDARPVDCRRDRIRPVAAEHRLGDPQRLA